MKYDDGDPHRAERQAAGPPGAADRGLGPERAGLPDGGARGSGGGRRGRWRSTRRTGGRCRRCRCRRRRWRRSGGLQGCGAAAGRDLLSRAAAGGGGRARALLRGCRGRACSKSVPSAMNFPHDHPLYRGNQWNDPRQNQALAEADCVLVVDSDVPWIPTVSRPAAGATIFHVDVDPLKEAMPLWYIGARLSLRADAATALGQLNAVLDGRADRRGGGAGADRAQAAAGAHRRRDAGGAGGGAGGRRSRRSTSRPACGGTLDADALVLNEGITNYGDGLRSPGDDAARGRSSLPAVGRSGGTAGRRSARSWRPRSRPWWR